MDIFKERPFPNCCGRLEVNPQWFMTDKGRRCAEKGESISHTSETEYIGRGVGLDFETAKQTHVFS